MNKRRFFKSLASIVATVALAPEICFRAKLVLPVSEQPALHEVFDLMSSVYSARIPSDKIEIYTDRPTADKIRTLLEQYRDSHPSLS